MRHKLLFLLCMTANACAFAQERYARNDIRDIAEYERLIKYYRYYKQDSAIYYAEKGIAFARQQKDSNAVALMLVQQGMIDDNLGEFENSLQKYNTALELFKTVGSSTGIATATIRIGVVDLRNGKYDNAIKHFFEALKVAEASKNAFGVMEANYSISWAHLDQHNYDQALQYLKIAERQNDSLPFSNISLNIFNHLGVVYRETNDYKKARYYFEKGVSLSDKPEYQGLNITLINNLASIYSKQGFKDKAIALQKGALQRSRELGNYLRELQALYGLARTYGKENPAEAITYLQQAVLLAREKGAFNQEMRYLRAITPLYVDLENYKEAFLAKEREKLLADSFVNKTLTQNIAALKAEYELSKSNARIKELDLTNQQRELQLENARMTRNMTFAGVAVLLTILGLLYNQYRIKQRNNKEISQKNLSLQHLVEEKEWLLKEVHHRVKNNLQTVMSLLESQSAYLENDALLAVQNSQHRVYAMSLIHQKLYQVDNTASANIDMSVYLPELLNYLKDSFGLKERIRFTIYIENILLDITQAIPVGLIMNEAITNSIKHAFPDNGKGEISIRMVKTPKKNILLTVTDNGVGLVPGMNKFQTGSLGFRLMKGLTEEIHGYFSIENANGTRIVVEFPGQHFFHPTIRPERKEKVDLQ